MAVAEPAAPAYVIHGDYYAPDADIDGTDPEILTHYAVAFTNTEAEASELVADLTVTNPTVDWYFVRQDVAVADAEPMDVADAEPVSMRFTIVDSDTDAEYIGTAISAATPAETMLTMVAQSFGVSRETVRIWETDNYREYGFDTRHGHRGTARFTDPAPTPYRPAAVTLTHSYI